MSHNWKYPPDMMCLAKAISSGYLPLSATLVNEEIYSAFQGNGKQFNHGSTNSGHPVCAAVGLANIDIIIREKLSENAARTGQYLKEKLETLMEANSLIGDIRGQGLMIGIELVKDKQTKEALPDDLMMEMLMDAAIHGMIFYYTRGVIGLLPPLIIDETIAEEMVDILSKILKIGTAANLKRKARIAKEFALK
jgi:adenosylmethionine-8-amino-7-oxononanoate aminotransferase